MAQLDVVFVPTPSLNLNGRTGVVIDVLRATTTIITALGSGCPEVLPVDTPEEAIDLARNFDRDSHLIGGERKGLKVGGFDLGNSPGEYTSSALNGRKVILCTTNGTHVIRRSAQAKPLYLAAFLNASSVAEALIGEDAPATLVCSGCEDAFALEDALCAGLIAKEVLGSRGWVGTDGANAAVALWKAYERRDLANSLKETDHGSYLASIGFADDVSAAAETDKYSLIPVCREGKIITL